MPPRGHNPDVVRIVRGIRGTVAMEMELVLRFEYGRSVPWVTRMDDGTLRAIAGPDMAVLRTGVLYMAKTSGRCSEFTVRKGESSPFVLTYGPSYQPLPQPHRSARRRSQTRSTSGRSGRARSQIQGEYRRGSNARSSP